MADYPGVIPDLDGDYVTDPLSFANFTALVGEQQAVMDTLGVNPQGSSATVVARLAALETRLASLANTGFRNLRVTNNVTTPTTKLDVAAELLVVEGYVIDSLSVTLDITVTGKNGTTSGRATSTWYYVWVGFHPTTSEACAVIDDAATRAGIDVSHASLAGFTAWRRVASWRTNATGSGELPRATMLDGWHTYDDDHDAATAQSATAAAWNTRTITTAVPPHGRLARVGALQTAGTTGVTIGLRPYNVTSASRYWVRGTDAKGETVVVLDASQRFEWSCDQTVSNAIWLWTTGYYDPI